MKPEKVLITGGLGRKRGWHWSEASRQKLSESMSKLFQTKEYRKKMEDSCWSKKRGRLLSDEHREKIRATTSATYQDPKLIARLSRIGKRLWDDSGYRMRQRKGHLKTVQGKAFREAARERAANKKATGYTYPESAKRTISEKQKKSWTRKRRAGHKRYLLKVWPIRREQMLKGLNKLSPNRVESLVEKRLEKLFPGEWKFVGNGQLVLGGKIPDFVNVNGQKKLIEVFGDYWHKGETGIGRIRFFRKFGFRTLILWERECKDYTVLTSKLREFHNL